MSEIFFYHLTRSSLEQTVFDLCSKCLGNGWRSVVLGSSQPVLEQLDTALWHIGGDESFLPHGMSNGASDQDQPILLTHDLSGAPQTDVLLLVSGAELDLDKVSTYKRLCIIFNGADGDELARARADWKRVVAAGISAKYWSQESGAWKMAAQSDQT